MGLGRGAKNETLDKRELAIPADTRKNAEALSLWLLEAEGPEAQIIRKPPPGGPLKDAERRTLNGGTASEGWALDYKAGGKTAELKRSQYSTLAALNRPHKASSGGTGWLIPCNGFAIGKSCWRCRARGCGRATAVRNRCSSAWPRRLQSRSWRCWSRICSDVQTVVQRVRSRIASTSPPPSSAKRARAIVALNNNVSPIAAAARSLPSLARA